MYITYYKVFSCHRILLLVYYVVQVVGFEPYVTSIKSRVHYQSATPAYGTEGWNRTIGNGLIRAAPSPLGYFRINVGYCSTINYLSGPLTLANVWCLREVSGLPPRFFRPML